LRHRRQEANLVAEIDLTDIYDDDDQVHNNNGRPIDNNNSEAWASAFYSRSPR